MNDVFNKDLFIVEGKIDWRLYALSLEAKIEKEKETNTPYSPLDMY